MRDTISTLFVFTALLWWGVLPAVAQVKTQNVIVSASLSVSSALTLTQEAALFFGYFQQGTGESTVTLTASQNPQLSTTGTLTILSTQGMSPGIFRVSGTPNASVDVIYENWVHPLFNASNNSVNISYIRSASNIILNTSGIGYFYIGGTITMWRNQPEGTYSGTYTVTVIYN